MSIAPGTRLGPYEVTALIGEGGMGRVYRASDTNLKRAVAIKVLPEAFASDTERLARFQREAEILAALNHPNIAHIHGLERAEGTVALVMELVEGPTLADRIAQGPISLDDAFPIARQIAEALEAAHEQGIIHRDLKPANIKVRPDSIVKVLDFGLAKAMEPTGAMSASVSMSPTIITPAMTQAGMILGTSAYMAPEQARGKPADKRSDIWAFGCVLYEMLTGRRAFEGDDITTTLAAVLTTEPDLSRLPATIRPALRPLLRRCLHKDPRERLRDIGEARISIDRMRSPADEASEEPSVRRALTWRGLAAATVAVLAIIAVALTFSWSSRRSTVTRTHVSRFTISTPDSAALSFGVSRDVAVTADGSRLVYVGQNGTTLFVRSIDQMEPTAIFRGGNPRDPFVSPDGERVGFFDGGLTLKKVPIAGGPAVLVARLDGFERGATWAADGSIIFATQAATTGLQRVSGDGGAPAALTKPDRARSEGWHAWPETLPGRDAVLYTVLPTTGGLDAASVAALDLRTGRSTPLLRGGTHAQYVASGHLVFAAGGTLRAVGFDAARLAVVGSPTPVIPHVRTSVFGAVDAGLARDGTLFYVTGGADTSALRTLAWVDRQGRETPIPAVPRSYYFPRLSPDGTRIAVNAVVDGNSDIWIWDLARTTMTRMTFDPAVDTIPLWSQDGRQVLFSSNRAGPLNLYSQAADGTGAVERLSDSPNVQTPTSLSPDGKVLVFSQTSPKTGVDVMAMRLDGSHQVLPLVQTNFEERNGVVSPDGRWLAYEADDTGAFEIYVRPFPEVNRGHWQVSVNGGTQPLWARNAQELFYFSPDGTLMRVGVRGEPVWTADSPTKLGGHYVVSTGGNFQGNYDLATDGQRFLMLKEPERDTSATPAQMVVVLHFDEELKRLVPTK